jgi:AcrR family transcriptional regulator
LNVVQTSRRARRRSARRTEILAVARRVVETEGLDGLTIKGLAGRLDCAVGTVYTYFSSKQALLAAMQADAIERLADAHDRVASRLEPVIASLDGQHRPLARLLLFGRCTVAAERHLPDEFHLQQRLLTAPVGFGAEEMTLVAPVAFQLLRRPQGMLEQAVAAGALAAGDPHDRTMSWMAAINGVLLLAGIEHPHAGLFDTRLLADRLTLDLLQGWGAPPEALDLAGRELTYELIDATFDKEIDR